MELPANLRQDGSGTQERDHARERELQESSPIPDVMQWNEISDECGMKEKSTRARAG